MSEPAVEPTPEPEQEPEAPPEAPGATQTPTEGEGDAVTPDAEASPLGDEEQAVSPEQPEESPEPDAEPQGAAPISEKEIDRIYVKMDKYRESNAGRVAAILGDQFEHAVPCPLCSHFSPGYIGLVDVPEDSLPIMRAILGMPDLSSFVPDPQAFACSTCQGKGQTLTGSLVPEYETRTCSACMGKGYGVTAGAPANGQPPAEAEAVMTGPLHVVDEDDDPAIAVLKARGYQVFPPLTMPQP